MDVQEQVEKTRCLVCLNACRKGDVREHKCLKVLKCLKSCCKEGKQLFSFAANGRMQSSGFK